MVQAVNQPVAAAGAQAAADAPACDCAELHARFRALLCGLLEGRLADALPGWRLDDLLAAVAGRAQQGQAGDDDEVCAWQRTAACASCLLVRSDDARTHACADARNPRCTSSC